MNEGRAPRALTYADREAMLAYGDAHGPQLLICQPLFEEMNRCRALVARICRSLTGRGYGCWLPDLPGCGESPRDLADVDWADWNEALADGVALIERETGAAVAAAVAIRGGALLDMPVERRWRLSPVSGASLLTDLRRAGLLESGAYRLSETLASLLSQAEPGGTARVVRLEGNDRACDVRLPGPAIWRRAEPEDSPELAARIVDDIDAWLRAGQSRP